MADIDPTSALLLRSLFEASDGLTPYTLYTRTLWSPAMLAEEIARVERLGLAYSKDGKLYISDVGISRLLSARVASVGGSYKREQCSPSLKWYQRSDVVGINMPYVPRRRGV